MDRKQSRHEKLPHRARCLPFGLRLRSLRSRLRLSNQFAAIEFITFFTGWTQSAFGPLFLGGVLGASLFWLFEFTSYFVTWFGRERNPEFVEECGYRASPLSQVDPWPCLLRLQSGFFRWCLLAPTIRPSGGIAQRRGVVNPYTTRPQALGSKPWTHGGPWCGVPWWDLALVQGTTEAWWCLGGI